MTKFFDLLRYFELHEMMKNITAQEIGEITGVDMSDLSFFSEASKKLSRLRELIEENPEKSGVFFKRDCKIPKNELTGYYLVLETINPGLVKKRHLGSTVRDIEFDESKARVAVNKVSHEFMQDHEIAAHLNLPIKQVKGCLQKLPAIQDGVPEFELLRRESHVREFFNLYPYSTVSEGAKALRMSTKETRVIVEDLIKHGEMIKFNNVPRPLEYEERKSKVIALKRNDPTLTEKDISLELEISVSQVRQAIQDTIRMWQVEKVINFEFYSLNMMQELKEIKDAAMDRHKASDGSSSRWLEIVLIAAQKEIDMLGLKAPERVDINKKITITKEQRDSVVDAYMATDSIDVDFERIEVTGS